MDKLKIKDLCMPCTETLKVKDSEGIKTAIERFTALPDVHALFVVDGQGRLKGIVKIRHLLNWVRVKLGVHQERRKITISEAFEVVKMSRSMKIKDILSPSVSVKLEDTLEHALNVMANEELVELAVVDEKNKLIGEMKLTSLMSKLLKQAEKEKSEG